MPQSPSVEDIEREDKKDWEFQIRKTKPLLSRPEFRNECLALKDLEAEDMMKVMQKVKP